MKLFSKKKQIYGEDIFKCPRCLIDMKKLQRQDVILDICKKCGGMWLDKDEIPKLASLARGEKQ